MLDKKLRFDGRVAVVTGSGAGLGRAYALLLADRGCSVVVNDLGGARDGQGKSHVAADAVVNEIRAKGGKAVSDYHSVEEGDKIIQTALDNFGRIDIVINNAGILRDRSFARISNSDWDAIQAVHLKGSFVTTQAAWPHFRKQKFGRVIMTSSASGLYGNFGQANYSAAKMALVGLSNTVAIEGQKSNIHCNVIVPTAASRLTEDILPPDIYEQLKPELIAPVVAWLCHESCTDNGSVIGSAAGWAAKYQLVRSPGKVLRKHISDGVTPEDVRDAWEKVTDMSSPVHLDSIQEETGSIMQSLEELKDKKTAIVESEEEGVFEVKDKDLILYALAVGASITEESNFRYLYENAENFSALPTFWILPGQAAVGQSGVIAGAIPGKEIDFSKLLHGEQYLELYKRENPTSGNVTSKCSVADVLDKGSGAVILVDVDTFDETGEKIAYAQMTVFIVGAGKFGGKRTSHKAIAPVDVPSRKPDAEMSEKTSLNQAVVYRLCGDRNPLHIDPSFAAMGGFNKPILHGLCSLGFSVRHVLMTFAGNDSSLFKAFKARFAKPVYPGQTLKTSMWRNGSRIHFQTSVTETNSIVIAGAYVDLHDVRPTVHMRNVSSDLMSEIIFDGIKAQMEAEPDKVKIDAIFVFNITKGGKAAGSWTVDCKKKDVYKGEPKDGKANCTVTVEDADWVDIAMGKANPQIAFMKGKLKVKGNIMLLQKFRVLMKVESKL
ncbi:peroxisomal multifunctional enzyme type 2 [Ischnura elegans]|uniref:peroxisomal multifunctional enzyme type 2 n=1 Tax=Ischnura elegans TaxID=197161 RepID=UPI001ED8A1D8|nr:peroxisomal multifunctional enzyme type 2 [Ischnura elegans]